MHSHIEMERDSSKATRSTLRQAKRRLLTVFGLLVVAVLLRHPAALLGAAGCFLFGLLWAGVSLRIIVKRLLLIIPFGLGAVVLLPFHTAGEAVFTLLGQTASAEGIRQAELILLKIVCANLLITYLSATTPQFLLIKSLRAVGIPDVLIEIISLMLRYFYLLKAEAQSMVKAQRSRGLVLDGWLWSRRTYKRFGELLGVLFLRSQGRSERIYRSIMARGGFAGHDDASERGRLGMLERGDMEAAIEVLGVSYRYGAIEALHNVSFRIQQGDKVALMGPNGAGKSTLISLLSGLEQPSEGSVRLLGESLAEGGVKRLRSRLGVVFQDPDDQIFSTTVEEDVAFGPGNMGLTDEQIRQRVEKALGAVHMLEYRHRSPFELSYGQKRRVAIAGVLAMEPDIIVLDEPMAFLDPKSRDDLQGLLEALHETGITLIVATHDVDFAAEWAQRVLLLKDGGLLAEGTTDLLFDDSLLSKADLHLPRLARPFRVLQGTGGLKPKTVLEAAQHIWKLMVRSEQQVQHNAGDKRDQQVSQQDKSK
jgi:cobalt ECF transporter T component CbiQ